jgi:4-amino-4-deoxy-L-arabinose transferase-like glycosyltransferase
MEWLAQRRGMAVVGGTALAARVLALVLTAGYRPHHDDRSYLADALAVARTHDYPVFRAGRVPVQTAYRAPGFPLLLAVVHVIGGHALLDERVAQVGVGVALVVLVYDIGRRLYGPRTALAAGLLAAVSPVLVLFDATLISEPLFTMLMLAALSCALARRPALAGVLVGLAALTRPEGLALIPAVALLLANRRAALVATLTALACVAPWTIRNAVVLHGFVPVSTETGNTLAGVYNARSLPDARWRDPRKFGLYTAARTANRDSEAATDRALTHDAFMFIKNHPADPARVALANATRVAGLAPAAFSRLSLGSVSLPTRPAWLLRAALLATTLLALAGAATQAARRAPPGWWLAGAVVAAVALLVNAEQRFAVPLQPFLLLLAPLPFTRGR